MPKPIVKNTKDFYIIVRIDIETAKKITNEVVREVVDEMNYSFKSKTKGVSITNTEICGINE